MGHHCGITIASIFVGGLLTGSLAGCGSADTRAAENAKLPFSVRLKDVRIKSSAEKPGGATTAKAEVPAVADPDAQAAPASDVDPKEGPIAPAMFDKTWEVTHKLTRVLEEANVFTRIVAADDMKTPVDLELEIEADGTDFGAGDATFLGSLTSTVVWLLAGHLSWFIDNREYQESNVSLRLSIRPVPASRTEGGRSVGAATPPSGGDVSPSGPLASAAEPKKAKPSSAAKKRPPAKAKAAPAAASGAAARPAEAVFQDALRLTGLKLNFIERAGVGNWFLNIFIPPWVGDGIPETAGQSLTHRAIEHFGETEPERLVFSFPASYFRSTTRYLVVPEAGKESVVIVSQGPIEAIAIRAEGRAERRIDDPDVVPLLAVEGAAKEELRLSIADRVVGIAGGSGGGSATSERYYRVALEPGEVGYVQVEVSPPIGNVLSRWTIYRKPPEGAAGGE